MVYDRYSDYQRNGRRILGLRVRPTNDTADFVVTSNLAYDRFEFYAVRKGSVQADSASYYRQLSARPHAAAS